MDFFINKGATLPVLRMELIQDGRYNWESFYNKLQNSNIYFTMADLNTGVKKIGKKQTAALLKESCADCDDCLGDEYYLSYKFSERDTNKEGVYIAKFIKKLLKRKINQKNIPISCFTATANYNTIEDVKKYFFKELKINFKEFFASSSRESLFYNSFGFENKIEKLQSLTEKIREINEPFLIYNPSSRKKCEEIAEQLSKDLNRNIKYFHAGVESEEKKRILSDYIDNKIDGIVATTAFGMGIDKPDIRHVFHYHISFFHLLTQIQKRKIIW
jgi:antitoxin component of RelBE/YafQ-DinJ toxin-antitoxin module